VARAIRQNKQNQSWLTTVAEEAIYVKCQRTDGHTDKRMLHRDNSFIRPYRHRRAKNVRWKNLKSHKRKIMLTKLLVLLLDKLA